MSTCSFSNTDCISRHPLTSHFNIISPHLRSSVTLNNSPPSFSSSSNLSLHLLNFFALHSVCSPYHSFSYLSLPLSFCFPLSLFPFLICLSGCLSPWMEEMLGCPVCLSHRSRQSNIPIIHQKIALSHQIQCHLPVSLFVLDCSNKDVLIN